MCDEKSMDYNIHYEDATFLTYTLTEKQFDELANAIAGNKRSVAFYDTGVIIRIRDIRSVVRLEPVPEETESFTPDVSVETLEYIRLQELAERHMKDIEDEEADYPGGVTV